MRDAFGRSLGDWGKQFGLLAVGFKRYGSREELEKDAIMHLFNVYVAVNADVRREEEAGKHDTSLLADDYFGKMENGTGTSATILLSLMLTRFFRRRRGAQTLARVPRPLNREIQRDL